MANGLFDKGREGILDGTINMNTGVIKAALVRGYTKDETDSTMADVVAGGGTIHVASNALDSKTFTNGVFDAADEALGTVASNANNHVVILYQASAVGGGADVAQASQRVVAHIDTGTNYPIVPNGGSITLAWDGGANKIFKL